MTLSSATRTPGKQLEDELNSSYGPGNEYYEDFCMLTKKGLQENWACKIELDGPRYRRSKLSLPCLETRFLSVTTIYMEGEAPGPNEEYSGQHHIHPYGEINCVIPIDQGAELKGMHGWRGPGWTSPGALSCRPLSSNLFADS